MPATAYLLLGRFGFSSMPDDPIPLKFRDAVARGVGHLLDGYPSVIRRPFRFLQNRAQRVHENVVAEDHGAAAPVQKSEARPNAWAMPPASSWTR